MGAMSKSFKYALRLAFKGVNSQSTTFTNFRNNEQSSNDFIISLCKQNLYKEALEAFDFLPKNPSFEIKPSTFAHLVTACSSLKSLEHGRRLHNHILASKCSDLILWNRVISMYGKCGAVGDARKVFDVMSHRNAVSWTSLIAGYSQNGKEEDAITLYIEMLQLGFVPDQFTFASVVKACSHLDGVDLGRQLHAHVLKSEFGSYIIAQNALIAMYSKFDQIADAWNVFSHINGKKDLISWSSIIAAFSQLGHALEALYLFNEMLSVGGFQPNQFIFGSTLSSCSSLRQPEMGMQIHGMCIKFGFARDNFAGCAVCDMYARFCLLDSARTAFYQIEEPDLASWNAVVAGIANGSDANEAMPFFSQMRCQGFTPNDMTLRTLLSSCRSLLTLSNGVQIHSYIIKTGFCVNISVCNALVAMYSKCSDIRNGYSVFEEIRNNADSVSWNTILTAFLQHKQSGEAFRLFKLMLVSHVQPDHVTITSLSGACAEMASLEMANQLHCYTMKTGLLLEVSNLSGFIDMFTKCGSLESARKLFDMMESPDIISWSSLILCYAQSGHGEEALKLFKTMTNLGVKPNHRTLLGVLTACSHVGLIEDGWQLYRTMETEYGIPPTREHSSCVVDLLARAGYLYEAEALIEQMAHDPDIVVWKTMLAACKTHGNIDIGKRAAENILKIDPTNSAAYVLLCNIYASSKNWGDVARLRSLMKQRGVTKVPGQSWIEIKDKMYAFSAKDRLHPEWEKIYAILEVLWLQMLDNGYFPSYRSFQVNQVHQ